MRTVIGNVMRTREDNNPPRFLKRIGSTTYMVSVYFSQTAQETLDDKVLRLIESEVKETT